MKRTLLSLLCLAGSGSLAVGQLRSVIVPPHFIGPNAALLSTAAKVPMFNYSVTASVDRGGGVFPGTIVGRSPFNHGKTTTSVPTVIIPLIITISDGTTTKVYDPTAVDPCVTPGSHTDLDVIQGSPIFTSDITWTMNATAVGKTQYIDAFQRAEFWSLVGGTGYHLLLAPNTLGPQSQTFTTGTANNPFGPAPCGDYGSVPLNDLDTYVRGLITGPLAGVVNIGTFPIFLTRNVFFSFGGGAAGGYHSVLFVGADPLIYSPFSIDTSRIFGGGDVSVLAHEMGEAINDPVVNNATPAWGKVGQVQPGCQANFEVGDPLTPGFPATVPPSSSNSFVAPGLNGLTYHLQELAFFSWFFGPPSLATPTKFSNNGTFNGDAKPCPPGGTN